MDNNRLSIQSVFGGKLVTMSSTLVETVSINYEDFSESFLTCSTCLCTYDGSEHTPKLLPCSHTVCLQCLTRILASGIRNEELPTSFRCPICRESINVPRGGVAALPPSFLVNQLLDLMATQRREVIPKCATHPTQELLFCETCDSVFCMRCTEGLHGGGTGSEHTVIPFAVAIKRMSEILLYRANECIGKLRDADASVSEEIRKLELSSEEVAVGIQRTFDELFGLVNRKKDEVMVTLSKMKSDKKKILEDQLSIIHSERSKVERECEGLQFQVEVRNITTKISDLNTRLDEILTLLEPRENSYLAYQQGDLAKSLAGVTKSLDGVASVRTSKTFPSLCTVQLDECFLHVETSATLRTLDYHGNECGEGGDPVSAHIQHESGTIVKCTTVDRRDGTYEVRFRPRKSGEYALSVRVFGRHVKNSPMSLICDGKVPLKSVYGSRGSGQLSQPVGVTATENGSVFVVDTGNDRLHRLTSELEPAEIITNDCLLGRSCTGICVNENGNLLVVNWRTKIVSELTPRGDKISSFTCTAFEEPVAVACNKKGQVLVADTGRGSVFVFDNEKLVRQIGGAGVFNLLAGVACGPSGEVVAADSRLQVFSSSGEFLREFYPEGKGKGRYGGVAVDTHGHLLVTRIERTRSMLQIFDYKSGSLLFQIECEEAKFRRPAGISPIPDGTLVVVDLGNECLKRFRYF